MIHFNSKEIEHIRAACQYYKSMVSNQSDHLGNDYKKLLDKLDYYEEENC